MSVLLPGCEAGYRSAPDGVPASSEAGPQKAMAWRPLLAGLAAGLFGSIWLVTALTGSGWPADTERFPGSSAQRTRFSDNSGY